MKGYSLHIGVNEVDQNHYQGLQNLRAAVKDANDMHELATQVYGYNALNKLLNQDATSTNVLTAIATAAEVCQENDIFLITYSGHGGLLDNIPGPNDTELVDQTWCLYDRQLIDDELYVSFSKFRPNVRILIISDSCHSGTVSKDIIGLNSIDDPNSFSHKLGLSVEEYATKNNLVSKKVSDEKAANIYLRNQELYDNIQNTLANKVSKEEVKSSVLLLAACQDDEVAFDGLVNGRFTYALKVVLKGGLSKFFNTPDEIISNIIEITNTPTPNYYVYGSSSDFTIKGNPFFIEPQTTFSININDKVSPILPLTIKHEVEFETINTIDVTIEDNTSFDLYTLMRLYNAKINKISINDLDKTFTITIPNDLNIWDAMGTIAQNADNEKIKVSIAETNSKNYPTKDTFITRNVGEEKGLMDYWPPYTLAKESNINWHLDSHHSQLKEARDLIWEKVKSNEIKETVRIGHLDTGWFPWHPNLKENNFIRKDLAKSFVEGEEDTNIFAEDFVSKGGENQGHGTGTLGLIAAGNLSFDGTDFGVLGAAPFIEIIPIRIAESVVILNDKAFAKGLRYAIEQNCDVVTMSMGGKPSPRMAKGINEAYENGVTVVTAAGNSMVKGIQKVGPRKLVYPARFDRVIAACGVCHNQKPYDFDAQEELSAKGSTRFMQGNWGPNEAMKTAIAAYTPNVPWLVDRDNLQFALSGGGTSSATPQVAAAAALWILKNKAELKALGYTGTWKQVEAVRSALFSSAAMPDFEESEKYYGNGTLRALDSLNKPISNENTLSESEKATTSVFGIIETVNLFINRFRGAPTDFPGENEKNILQLELQDVLGNINISEVDIFLEKDNKTEDDLLIIEKYRNQILAYGISENLRMTLGF